jgi:RNA polymerase sigma factor (sigma-70 family)
MTTATAANLLRQLRRITAGPADTQRPDHELVERFRTHREEEAFAELVRRHGPMVLNLCRTVLRHEQDAEDVFQATFLVLARKAGSIRRPGAVAGWLHEVAYHLALKARTEGRRPAPLSGDEPMPTPDPILDMTLRELRTVLHEELRQLPERYRAPLVLCYLEGKTQEEAARQLGWSRGAVRGRVNRGRDRLRNRLVQRGLTLPAGGLAAVLAQNAVGAPVPAALAAAAVRGGRLLAAGEPVAKAVTPSVLRLAQGALNGLAFSKLLIATAVLIAAGFLGVAALAPQLAAQKTTPPASARRDTKTPKTPRAPRGSASRPAAGSEAKDTIAITGRVLDAAGKAVAGAHVAVVSRPKPADRIQERDSPMRLLAQGVSDRAGRFRMRVPPLSAERYWAAFVLAARPGQGLGHRRLKPGPTPQAGDVRLPREQPLRGRLFGLEGKPAAGVQVGFVWLTSRRPVGRLVDSVNLKELAAAWRFGPGPTVSDRAGRFTLRGLGPELWKTIETAGEGFARQQFEINPEDRGKRKEFRFSLDPARVLDGTVRFVDTRAPVPGARLRIEARRAQPRAGDPGGTGEIEIHADAQGRFHAVPHAGSYFTLIAYPPPASAYLPLRKSINWPAADVVKHRVDLTLLRGIRVRGTVTEKASGKPVAGASVDFTACGDNNPYYDKYIRTLASPPGPCLSGPDGKFEIIVPPGPGHLLINGPTPDYLRTEIGSKKLYGFGIGPERRYYIDGLAALDLKPQKDAHEVRVVLRRGVAIWGKVLGPDRKPVARATLVSRAYLATGMTFNGPQTKEVKDGRFELPGCDPDKPVEVFFYHAKGPWAAVALLSAKKAAGRPVTVRLRPCCTATARFVDQEGKPLAGVRVVAEFVISPGLPWAGSFNRKGVFADTFFMANLDVERHNDLRTDTDGRVTIPALIPGATYRLSVQPPQGGAYDSAREFQVKAGQTLRLGDLVVPPRR